MSPLPPSVCPLGPWPQRLPSHTVTIWLFPALGTGVSAQAAAPSHCHHQALRCHSHPLSPVLGDTPGCQEEEEEEEEESSPGGLGAVAGEGVARQDQPLQGSRRC